MNKIEYQSNGQPIATDFTDLRAKLGYKVYEPKIGSMGRALIKASKEGNHRSIGWLKHQLDNFFKKERQNKKVNKVRDEKGKN